MVYYDLSYSLVDLLISILYLLVFFLLGRFLSDKAKVILLHFTRFRFIKSHIREEDLETISTFFHIFIKYIFYLIGLILALANIKVEFLNKIAMDLLEFLPNLILASIFFITGLTLAGFIKEIIKNMLKKEGLDEFFPSLEERFKPSELLGNAIKYSILLITVIVSLSQLGLKIEILSWLTFSLITIFVIFLFVIFYTSIKEYLPDIFAGIIIRYRKYFRVGEYINIDNKKYRVLRIGVIFTQLKEGENVLFKRNSEILKSFKLIAH